MFETTCPQCGETRLRAKKNYTNQKCPSCAQKGPANANWKGGLKQWETGRFGKDKDGYSWKVQRRLALERDNYCCQHCGIKLNRNPDVHHISPWMNSHSHALSNLICLCQKCHLVEESKIQETWGGGFLVEPTREKCPTCKKNLSKIGFCRYCNHDRLVGIEQARVRVILSLVSLSLGDITSLAKEWGTSHTTVRRFINRFRPDLGMVRKYPRSSETEQTASNR